MTGRICVSKYLYSFNFCNLVCLNNNDKINLRSSPLNLYYGLSRPFSLKLIWKRLVHLTSLIVDKKGFSMVVVFSWGIKACPQARRSFILSSSNTLMTLILSKYTLIKKKQKKTERMGGKSMLGLTMMRNNIII